MEKYKFNPEEHGFENISKFPELMPWFGNHENTFIKVVAVGGKEFDNKVYWFKAYSPTTTLTGDDRITFYSGSWDARKQDPYNENSYPKVEYRGLVSNDIFAKELLYHLLGTTRNESVQKEGFERLNTNLNDVRFG